jgi:glutathione-regulated potassium-efflux system ancillary protein KefC
MLDWLLPITAVFASGALAAAVRLPPLVGFLVAGFALNTAGVAAVPGLGTIADVGVTLLLFSIGLKLDIRQLFRREVVTTAWTHLAASIAVIAGLLAVLAAIGVARLTDGAPTILLIAFALSFSSTVFVVKTLEDRNQSRSLYGRTAIGILIWQDIAAVAFIVATSDGFPSPWAVLLVLLVFVRWPVFWLWSRTGHGELQLLLALVLALVVGYGLFEAVGLKGELGALLIGVLLAGHPRASEMSSQLLSLKDLLLVGFFVSIGYTGMLSVEAVVVGLALVLLIPVQSIAYAFLLRWNRLRRRTAALCSLALANHSEFGLIVVAVGIEAGLIEQRWLVILSVTVAAGMILGSLLNQASEQLVPQIQRLLPAELSHDVHPEDRPVDFGDATVLVLGLGRVGSAACQQLTDKGQAVLGVETDSARVRSLQGRDFKVVEADATDGEFWERVVNASTVQAAVLAMPFHGSNMYALESLERAGFTGQIVAAARYDDDVERLVHAGADDVLQVYEGAGDELADRVRPIVNQPSTADRNPATGSLGQ